MRIEFWKKDLTLFILIIKVEDQGLVLDQDDYIKNQEILRS